MPRYHIFFDGIFEIDASTQDEAKKAALEQLMNLSGLVMVDASNQPIVPRPFQGTCTHCAGDCPASGHERTCRGGCSVCSCGGHEK